MDKILKIGVQGSETPTDVAIQPKCRYCDISVPITTPDKYISIYYYNLSVAIAALLLGPFERYCESHLIIARSKLRLGASL